MANTYPKTTVIAGDLATATYANAVQTQADYIEADLGAGRITVAASSLNGTIAAARLPTAVKSLFLSAAGGKARTTSGCAPPAWVELATNKIMVVSLDFDTASDEYCQWPEFALPDGYDGGTISVRPHWTAASGSGTVCWSISGRSYANDEALDQAQGSAATSTDTLITANDEHVGPAATVTLGGTPAGGELCIIQCMRDVSADTLDVDAKLLGLMIELTMSYTD